MYKYVRLKLKLELLFATMKYNNNVHYSIWLNLIQRNPLKLRHLLHIS